MAARKILGALAAVVTAASLLVLAPGPLGSPASAAVDPNLGPVAPPGETFCYAAADDGDRLAFIRMVGAPGDPGFSIQVDRLRLGIGRSNVEALAIRPSGGIYAVDDASGSTPFGRIIPGEFDPTVDGDATTNPTARGDFSLIANLTRGGSGLDLNVDGLTFIETNNLISADDILLGSVRRGGNDTLVTIAPGTGETSVEWSIAPPPELTTVPDDDGITNIVDNDIDDIGWDPESDIVYAVLGGSGLNYLGRLVWVLDDGAGGEIDSTTVPRSVGGTPDFSDLLRLDFVRLGDAAVLDVEGLGFSNVGATFGQFFGTVGANSGSGATNNRLLAFDKADGATTALINLNNDPAQGTGNGDYEGVDCVQPILPGSLTIGEEATPADGTRFTFAGGDFGAVGSGGSNDGLADGETEAKTVNAGTYVISQDPLSAWSLDDITCTGDLGFGAADWSIDLGARTLTVTVDAGQNVECTFENSQTYGSIGDRVWLDENDDGIQDVGEPGLNGITVTLRDSGGAVVATQDTSGDGTYLFTDVLPGDYTVEVDMTDLPTGASQTYDLDGLGTPHSTDVTVAVREDRTDVDFGYAIGSIQIEKTVYAGDDAGAGCPGTDTVGVESGDDVIWCFVVTNTGDVTLSDVTVVDPDLGIDAGAMTVLSGDLASIPAGGEVHLAYGAPADNDLLNTATATGDLPHGGQVADDDAAEVTVLGPAVDIEKTVYRGHDGGAGCAGAELVQVRSGGPVTYCFEVTNTGQTNLSAVTVTDPDLAITAGDGLVVALLAPGQSQVLWWETTADGDLLNTATVVGTSPAGAQPTASDTAEVDEIHPAIEVRKTVELGDTDGAACPGVETTLALDGDTVTWCFEVENTGDVDLTDVRLDDPALLADQGDMTVLAGSLASLPVGGTVSLYLEGPASADVANTVTATATPPVGGDVTDDDTAAIDVIDPAVTLEKTVYLGHDGGAGCGAAGESVTGEVGEDVTWCFAVTNAVDQAALFDVRVDDPDLGIDQTDMTLVSGDLVDLAEGETVVLWYEGTISGPLANTATATASPPLGPDVSDDDDASVASVTPAISIEKTVYGGHDGGASCASAGELVEDESGTAVTWCFEVTNTGEVPLTDVVIDDPELGLAGLAVPDLAVGQTEVLSHEAVITADLVNDATVTGTSPHGVDVSDDDTAEVDLFEPAIGLAKGVYAGHDDGAGCGTTTDLLVGRAGDDITWCFLVTNTGETDLDVTVEDLDLGVTASAGLTVLSGSLTGMGPGDTAELYLESTIDGDLLNTGTAVGETPGGATVEDPDSAAVDEVHPAISLSTTNYGGHDGGAGCEGDELSTGLVGEDLTYCWVITNTGDVTLTDIALDDLDVGIDETTASVLSGSLASLAAGDSVVLYLETAFSVDLVNSATATGTPPVGADVTDEDPSEVDVVAPGISVTNTVYRGHDGGAGCEGAELVTDVAGTDVTYCFAVTNDGDVPLDVALEDLALGIDETDVTVLSGSLIGLAPGDTVVVYLEAAITGDLGNTVTAVGTPPTGPDVTDDDPSEVEEIAPAINVEKTVYAGHDAGAGCQGVESLTTRPGDAVTYCFVVTNTGDAALDQITLDDADLGVTDGDMFVVGVGLAMLLPGDSITFGYETTVDGDLVNTVDAEGRVLDGFDAPIGGPNGHVSDSDTAEVDEVHPAIEVQKTVYGGHDGGAGCPGGESVADEAGRPVTWCFEVTNTGDVALDDITLVDGDLGVDESDLSVLSGSLSSLAAGDSVVLFAEGTLDGDLVNVATASGVPPVGQSVSDDDDASVEVLVPGVHLEKTVYRGHDGGSSCAGGESVIARAGVAVTWCFVATNTGEVPLDVTVDDDDLGFTDVALDVAPGDSHTFFFEGTVDGDLVNVATVTGDPPHGPPVEDDDEAEVDEIDPGIRVDKTVYAGHDGGASCEGGEVVTDEVGVAVTWCFTITNTGDVALDEVSLDDAVLGVDEGDLSLLSGSLASLPVDGTISAFVEGVIDGDVTNTATVTATAPDGGDVSDADTAATETIAPQIGVAKTVIDGPTGNGDGTYEVTYRIRVANAGETPLEGVQVVDDLTETFVGVRGFEVIEVTSADLTVNAGYTGKPGGSIELLAGTDRLDLGERGDIELTVRIDPGRELGPFDNTATATGTSPNQEEVTDVSDSGTNADPTDPNPDEPGDTGGTDDPVPVQVPPIDLVVTKTVADVQDEGDTALVTWDMVVTNDGPGDDPGPITLVDELDGRLAFVSAAGEGWTCSAAGQVVTCVWAAPLAAGETTEPVRLLTDLTVLDATVTNQAVVSSTGAESRTDNNDDDAEVSAQQATPTPTGTLPRTGASIGGLVLLGLGLVLGGRLLRRRAATA